MPTLIPTPTADPPTSCDDHRVENLMKDDSRAQRDGDHDFFLASEHPHHVCISQQIEHGTMAYTPVTPIYQPRIKLTLLPRVLYFFFSSLFIDNTIKSYLWFRL